ncbi:MAG: hypothetical protein GY811_13360 [Myxococcales bacterium]|nr:hypothetical protein [Myxococcales bacterium]
MRAQALAFALVLAPAALALGVGTAEADGFDDKVKMAKPIHSAKSMAALFWSQKVSCGATKNDLLRRQCQGVRDQRQSRITQDTFLVEVGTDAIDILPDAKKMSVQVDLRSCLWCGDEGPVVVGKGAHKVDGGKVKAFGLSSETKLFEKAKRLEHWTAHLGPRLRAQLLVKVPTNVEQFKVAGRSGYKVDVVGYRLFDPCRGVVFASSPASKKAPVNASSCKGEPELKVASTEPKVPVIVHPDRLTTAQIKAAMKEVSSQTRACFDAYGIEGMATFEMIIAGSGKLAKAKQTGDFEGTPTGICLDKAIQAASFPKSKKKKTPITYPIVLR